MNLPSAYLSILRVQSCINPRCFTHCNGRAHKSAKSLRTQGIHNSITLVGTSAQSSATTHPRSPRLFAFFLCVHSRFQINSFELWTMKQFLRRRDHGGPRVKTVHKMPSSNITVAQNQSRKMAVVVKRKDRVSAFQPFTRVVMPDSFVQSESLTMDLLLFQQKPTTVRSSASVSSASTADKTEAFLNKIESTKRREPLAAKENDRKFL